MNNSLEQYLRIVDFLGDAISDLFEIYLFDTTDKELSVIARKNRISKSEKCTKALVCDILKRKNYPENSMLTKQLIVTDNGKMIKCSVFLIRDNDEIVGAMCINMACNQLCMFQDVLESLLSFKVDEERYKNSEPSIELLEQVVNDFTDEPKRLSIDERIELICDLYELGIFDVKGSVAKTAELFGISDKSVYRYISKIKDARSV